MKSSGHLRLVVVVGAAAALTVSSPCRGDEPGQHEHAFRNPPERLGTVNFPISCNDAARREFQRGIALLHSFWYDAAEKSFRGAAESDPACGMAWWGVAMSNFHPVWAAGNPGGEPSPAELARGIEAAAKAKAAGATTERERDYIDAVSAYYRDAATTGHPARARAFESAMETVYRKNPNDREAGIFYALSILGTSLPSDKTYAGQKKAAEILNRILPDAPDHPGIAHYVIHSFDYPSLASLALPAARSYAKIAPDAPHALHMPSHIFTRLGLWDDSIQSNLASSAAARKYVEKTAPGVTSFDDLHALDYLEYAYLQIGRDGEAAEVARRVGAVERLDVPNFAAAYCLAAVPVRYTIERRDWAGAAKLEQSPASFPWAKFRNAEAILVFGRALGSARSGDVAGARAGVTRLESIGKELEQRGDLYWARQVEIERLEAASWTARAEGNNEESLRLAKSAAELEASTDKHPVTPGPIVPARELYGDLLLEVGKPAAALSEYEASLVTSPRRLHALAGATRAAAAAGDRVKAKAYSDQLNDLTRGGDGRRSEIAEALQAARAD